MVYCQISLFINVTEIFFPHSHRASFTSSRHFSAFVVQREPQSHRDTETGRSTENVILILISEFLLCAISVASVFSVVQRKPQSQGGREPHGECYFNNEEFYHFTTCWKRNN
jgi:hypothetical protein